MRRLKFTIAYDGTAYFGWQVQPMQTTIQGTLQDILTLIDEAPVSVVASGRTDAGVHALAQVAACNLNNPIPCDNLRRALNHQLPHDIRVLAVEQVPEAFHPRFDALAKTYEYRLFRAEICLPFERRYVCHRPYPLDWDQFARAADVFVGEHDFTAFSAADERDAKGLSKVRRIYSAEVRQEGDRVWVRFRGSGFLKHMVRNLIGTMLDSGKGHYDNNGIREIIASKDRSRSGSTAPPEGLFLVNVEYPPAPF